MGDDDRNKLTSCLELCQTSAALDEVLNVLAVEMQSPAFSAVLLDTIRVERSDGKAVLVHSKEEMRTTTMPSRSTVRSLPLASHRCWI